MKNKYDLYNNNQLSKEDQKLFSKIFECQQNIIDILRHIFPEIEEHRPCFDFEKRPVDASIATNRKNKFCLSSLILRHKVTEHEILAQTIALEIHEYSEVMGRNEEEVVALQTRVLNDLR